MDSATAKIYREFFLGDTLARYILCERTAQMGLQILPERMSTQVVKHRETLEGVPEIDHMAGYWSAPPKAWQVEPLVQVSCAGDIKAGGFAQGQTLRGGSTTAGLKFQDQRITDTDERKLIVTNLTNPGAGLAVRHMLSWLEADPGLSVWVEVQNIGTEIITVEMLSSFAFGFITPFDSTDAPERLFVHRFRSAWSSEGRHEVRSVEELGLERSWSGHGVRCERFGQIGTKPVRRWFPFVAVEDRKCQVLWGAQLAWPGSWQMEVYRRDDFLHLSGGLADRELGHWCKELAPGALFVTPQAAVASVKGDIDDLCRRLVAMQKDEFPNPPPSEAHLPILFNDWCTSWGRPTEKRILGIAERLATLPVEYLVVDSGWYVPEGANWENAQGDWFAAARLFPGGMKTLCREIRRRGLTPGIWFEPEVVGPSSRLWQREELQLHRDGKPIQVGERRFLDMRRDETHRYLRQRVIDFVKQNGFGYLKVDHNETIGLGVDGAESPGEGLRQHVEGVQRFFRELRAQVPGLIIENCSSGGHRLEPSMVALTDMSSFSDAHEAVEIPIIAANLQRLVPARKLQIWAVLRSQDSDRRLVYSLAAPFLGRMCLSGDIEELSEAQWALLRRATELYREVWPLILKGQYRRFGPQVGSYRHPKGWQAVLRRDEEGGQALAVVHRFEDRVVPIGIPLEAGKRWRIMGLLNDTAISIEIEADAVMINGLSPFSAAVVYLRAEGE